MTFHMNQLIYMKCQVLLSVKNNGKIFQKFILKYMYIKGNGTFGCFSGIF